MILEKDIGVEFSNIFYGSSPQSALLFHYTTEGRQLYNQDRKH